MNELFFNWRKRLNIKKVIIVSLIIITIILLILFLFFLKEIPSSDGSLLKKHNVETTTTTFFDKNRSVSLELSNNYELNQYTSNQDYLLELRSNKNLNIFISFKDNIISRSFWDIVNADKTVFVESFPSASNISEVKEIQTSEYTGFTYNFQYLDEPLNATFYIQVSWLEIDGNYYIFDVEFPLDDLNNYTNIVTDVLSNFKKQ